MKQYRIARESPSKALTDQARLKDERYLWIDTYTQLRHIGIRLAVLCLSERTKNGLMNVAGLRCGLRPKRSGDLEQSLSDIFPVYRLEALKGKTCCRQVKFYSGVYALA
jgi:hypothetical protein